jgi:hypothetical protein
LIGFGRSLSPHLISLNTDMTLRPQMQFEAQVHASIFILMLAATALAPSNSGTVGAVKFDIAGNCRAEGADASGVGEMLESRIEASADARSRFGDEK